jgi:hypothetical protein
MMEHNNILDNINNYLYQIPEPEKVRQLSGWRDVKPIVFSGIWAQLLDRQWQLRLSYLGGSFIV